MISISLDPRWQVRLTTTVDLPFSAEEAWTSLADFERYACMDVFHRRVEWRDDSGPCRGADFILPHSLAGIGTRRVGRILRWSEGRGYAFSDLSRHGPRRGFPHVFQFELSATEDGCELTLEVRGLWTLRILPRGLVRLWLGAVFWKISKATQTALLSDAVGRRRNSPQRPIET